MTPDSVSLTLINKVRAATRVYYHSNCPDGIISRELLRYLISDGYNSPVDSVEFIPHYPATMVEVTPGAVFIDVSPEETQWEAFLQAGAIILDHHDTVLPLFEKYREQYPDQLVFGDTSATESGAWLAYTLLEYWGNHENWISGLSPAYVAAKLIAVGDCWCKENIAVFNTARALGRYIALAGNDWDFGIPGQAIISEAVKYGHLTEKQSVRMAKRSILKTHLSGLKVAFFNTTDGISDIAEIMRNEYGADLVVNWYSHCIKINDIPTEVTSFSLRAGGLIDCGKFARYVSPEGGGHKNAAGFQVIGVITGIDYILGALTRFLEDNNEG